MSATVAWLPASFRGAPFWIDETGTTTGRRVAVFGYPYREEPSSEDLGRLETWYHFRGFTIGPTYAADRDALFAACGDGPQSGTLVHPLLGALDVRCVQCNMRESREAGAVARFDLVFVESGTGPAPFGAGDTASSLLSGVASAIAVVENVYASVALVQESPAAFAASLLGGFGAGFPGSISGLTMSSVNALLGLSELVSTTPTAPATTAANVTALFAGAVAAIAAEQLVVPTPDDPVAGSLPALVTTADPTYGLAASALWGLNPSTAAPGSALAGFTAPAPGQFGAPLPPVIGTAPAPLALAATQQAVTDLICGSAVAAICQVFANTEWQSANAAAAARTLLLALIDVRMEAATEAGNQALYLAWQGLGQLAVADLTQRAQALPTIGPYDAPTSLPALVLAQRLYQDPTRAAQLALLNDSPAPLFMAPTGLALSA